VVCSVAEDGSDRRIEFETPQPSGIGWLPDGSLLAVAMVEQRVYRRLPSGEREEYVDLSEHCRAWVNDMLVGPEGHVWISQLGFDVMAGEAPTPVAMLRIDPDRSIHVAAPDLLCPNGMLITPDGSTFVVAEWTGGRFHAFDLQPDWTLTNPRIFAQLGAAPESAPFAEFAKELTATPDGCAMDADGHVWGADLVGGRMVHLDSDGGLIDEIPVPDGLSFVTCALGGADGRTLVMAAAPGFDEASRRNADDAVLFATRVEVGRGGLP